MCASWSPERSSICSTPPELRVTASSAGIPAILPGAEDTIAAIATPPGRGAIAIVRMSGPAAHDVGRRVLAPWPLAERQATLCSVRHPETGLLLDRALVTIFGDERSFTGEPTIEIATHGGSPTSGEASAGLARSGSGQRF